MTTRVGWADTAKGACILLVVLWHVIMKHYLQIGWHAGLLAPGAWGTFGELLLPLRMPLFFTISGMFAAAAVARPWPIVARSRVVRFFYLYALWFVVHTIVLTATPDFDTLAAHSVADVVEQLTITPTNLWYLPALAVYFVVAKVTRRWPTVAVLPAAFALSAVASSGSLADPGNRGQLLQNLLFFLAGVRLRAWVQRWAGAVTLTRLAWTVGAFAVMVVTVTVLAAQRWFGVWPVMSAVAVTTGVALATRVERWPVAGAGLAELGRRTLPIYVLHMPLLALVDLALRDRLSGLAPAVQAGTSVVWPVLLTALLTVVCLALHSGLLAARAAWLFDLPRKRERHAAR